jgi:FdhD protein
MTDALQTVGVVRVNGHDTEATTDRAAAEEPLEVRLHGRPFAVIMRTPGADRELTAGFLLAERVLTSADDLGTIEYCADEAPDARRNVINVVLVAASAESVERALAGRRQVTISSSCGMCGRSSIESVRISGAPLGVGASVTKSILCELPDRLRCAQPVFDQTGGLHAAGLFTLSGILETSAEDVGRHNAVDKVIGRMLMKDALPLSVSVLFVSGRTSFEIVQKAFLAGIPVVASVSAPSSLAIDLAREIGITLVGFLRGASFNIYSHPQRIA